MLRYFQLPTGFFLLVSIFSPLTACISGVYDIGLYYDCFENGRLSNVMKTCYSSDGIFIASDRIGGLTGQNYTDINICIANRSQESSISLTGVALKTFNDFHVASFRCKDIGCDLDIGPLEERRFKVWWNFEKTLAEVFKEPVLLEMNLRIDGKASLVRIPLRRSWPDAGETWK
ncbi:MAG: hypothetical protein AAGU11_18160 [Syntrophobacteraceae bacterium]